MSEKKGFFGRLVEGLTKTRDNIISGMDSIFSGFSAIDDDFYEEIEETLIMGDLGIQTTMSHGFRLYRSAVDGVADHIPVNLQDLIIALRK